ncbi:MAG: adenylate/guanylate cyclase domain-containing protein [Spirochaetes bacterium]|nr:adenylate/guanylate cyclase domain-containing protein [Spirochaetota bacterium]MBN2769975.1 adenylate/guanylate cyclase domain-containing protein [Spirochaetota bacterium]
MHPLNAFRLKKMYLPVIVFSIVGIGISYILTLLFPRDGFELDDILIGAVIGALIMIIIGLYEIFISRHIKIKLPPLALILFNSIVYFIIITVIAGIIIYLPEVFFDDGNEEIDISQFLIILLFCFLAIVLVQFILLLNSFFGKGVLANIMLGRYHKQKNVKLIFMMLDLKSYTSFSEKSGDLEALSYLNNFYDDVSSAAVICNGDIYRYVGDEIIITWPMKTKKENAKCIKCFYLIKDIIERKSAYYKKRYGVVPRFRTGLHVGPVVIGQLGSIKREITYIGDVINTTSRVEEICKETETDILVSGDLLKEIDLGDSLCVKNEYKMNLRGKEREVILYSIERK